MIAGMRGLGGRLLARGYSSPFLSLGAAHMSVVVPLLSNLVTEDATHPRSRGARAAFVARQGGRWQTICVERAPPEGDDCKRESNFDVCAARWPCALPRQTDATNLFLYAPPHWPTAGTGCKKESNFDVYGPPPADRRYPGLDAAMRAVSEVGDAVRDQGVPPDFGPLVIAITGNGNASRGAQARRRALFLFLFFPLLLALFVVSLCLLLRVSRLASGWRRASQRAF